MGLTKTNSKKSKLKIIRLLYFFYYKIIRTQNTPHEIALSFSVGAFIGVMPTFGIASILCIIVATFFKLNIAVTVLGSWISNPWTSPIFYTISYEIGKHLIIFLPILNNYNYSYLPKFHIIIKTLQYMVIGGIILGLIIAIICYIIIYNITLIYQEKKRMKNA